MIMRYCQKWMVFCLAILLLSSQVFAVDRVQRAEVAKEKAEALEQAVATEGSDVNPPDSLIITKPGVQAVDPTGRAPLDDAITCLARSIYWEARGESVEAMEAVADVVINRLAHEGFPDTVCEVVRQGGEQGSCQFSWWCDGRMDHAENEQAYATAKEISRRALNGQLEDRIDGALYFHHRQISPGWGRNFIKTNQIDDLVFYKLRDGVAP
ncbi:cell wall hydrolase [Halomonas sp. M20]|uniref:cell wall hydrolase n=1 Tax=Halomonas sp. M20 TaxID=2763264 RepID=UPI001D0B8299|nr:cell wall hydrolase [Halomonas sp. M20]